MTKEDFEAFKKALEEYPSQDNEGYQPPRDGFKCGWFSALNWDREVGPSHKRIIHLESANSQLTEDVEHWKTCFEESMESLNHTVAKVDKLVKALEEIANWAPEGLGSHTVAINALKEYRGIHDVQKEK